MTTDARARYRVAWPMVQIMGAVPGHREEHLERILRQGDIVPVWVPETEVTRLASSGFIEAIS